MTDISAALAGSARQALDAAGPSVVRIGSGGGRGCGVVVADGAVLTNAHNLRDRTTEVTFADGRRAQGEVTAIDPDGDLVVLHVDTAGAPPIAWATDGADAGEVVFTVARSADRGTRVTFGMVSGVERTFRGPRGRQVTGSLEHTAPLLRGSSGSPVLDGAGRLLALNTARLGDGFYLALPADAHLRGRVDALLRGESPQRLVLGVAVATADVAAALRASVGLDDRAGLLVRAVDPGGAADGAGVLVGDLIVAAGGRPVASVDDLHQALDAASAGTPLPLRVVRGTDEVDLEVAFPA
jgi:S1-C subfamily serine protease